MQAEHRGPRPRACASRVPCEASAHPAGLAGTLGLASTSLPIPHDAHSGLAGALGLAATSLPIPPRRTRKPGSREGRLAVSTGAWPLSHQMPTPRGAG